MSLEQREVVFGGCILRKTKVRDLIRTQKMKGYDYEKSKNYELYSVFSFYN